MKLEPDLDPEPEKLSEHGPARVLTAVRGQVYRYIPWVQSFLAHVRSSQNAAWN